MESIPVDTVRDLLTSRKTYAQISNELKRQYPQVGRGLSARSIHIYVKENGIKVEINKMVEETVQAAVAEVGDSYGRKMMKGYLQGYKGLSVSERKIRGVLPSIAPQGHSSRVSSASERRNPALYYARYFGHKLHLDQNEKLVHYGVTYVLARDGFSGKIVAGAIMPRKNNPIIYDEVYRQSLLEYGLWDQIRVDHGKEFYLTLYIHEQLRLAPHGDPEVVPYAQTTSTQNHIIVRIWVELNKRVTYPIKTVLSSLDNNGIINMDCPVTKFAVSTVLIRVCQVGMNRMIAAWNSHPIPGRGIPNQLQVRAFNTSPIHPSEIPDVTSAVDQYRLQGGRLTDPSTFGVDPLSDDAVLQNREERWSRECDSPEDIFSATILGNSTPLENAIQTYITLTNELAE